MMITIISTAHLKANNPLLDVAHERLNTIRLKYGQDSEITKKYALQLQKILSEITSTDALSELMTINSDMKLSIEQDQ